MRGGENNDKLYGGAGNDSLIGGYNSSDTYASNDWLDGGVGDDEMRGYLGDDTYVYGSGLDYAYDTAGFDVIRFDGAIAPEDMYASGESRG